MGISGKYELVSSDNLEAYLKAVGVSDDLIKLATTSKPVLEVTESGNTYLIRTITPLKTFDINFEDGKEFTETIEGRSVQSTITRNGNVFVQIQKSDGNTATTTRTFTDDTITAVSVAGGITATRVYKRV